ncbi:hypothetical protein [Longitalea luteola]|uniref:hypothetical protein n=1 Tax=Longitalea luteola TaxID=2812563 RepID=UPI001A96E6B3|nr:hypothetical protein [Longitalea luteola]
MDQSSLNIKLNIEKRQDLLVAHLLFSNNTTDEIYLDRQTLCTDSKTHRNVFKVFDEKKNKVDYVGRFVNREVRPEDFFALKAGESVQTSVVLSEVYKITTGNKYFIQYSVFHPTYMDDAGFTNLESNIVEVSY